MYAYFLFRQIWGGERFFLVLQPYLAVNYGMPQLHEFPKVWEPSQNSKCQKGSVLRIHIYWAPQSSHHIVMVLRICAPLQYDVMEVKCSALITLIRKSYDFVRDMLSGSPQEQRLLYGKIELAA
jgi:hypothetical protein